MNVTKRKVCNSTGMEMLCITHHLLSEYGKDLAADITADTSFGLEDMLVGLLEGVRDQSTTVNRQEAKEDAQKLYKVHIAVSFRYPVTREKTLFTADYKNCDCIEIGSDTIWTTSNEFGTYRLCEQRRFRQACASKQSRQNLRCSLIQAVS